MSKVLAALTDQDAAVLFRDEEHAIELIVPGCSTDAPMTTSGRMAALAAYLYERQNEDLFLELERRFRSELGSIKALAEASGTEIQVDESPESLAARAINKARMQ